MRSLTLRLLRMAAGGAAAVALMAGCGAAPAGHPGQESRTSQGSRTASPASQPDPASQTAPASNTGPAPASGSPPGSQPGRIPVPARTAVVVMENHGYGDVIGSPAAPFINTLARRGALLTRSYAVTHPSEPNYLALFSGSTHGVTSDACPVSFAGPNLATGLLAAHRTFAGYSEGLPRAGSPVCAAGLYARKHVPWADFSNVPAAVSKPFRDFGAGGYASLPSVSFVIPDLCDDMHNCPVVTGDQWLRRHLAGYARWAMTHRSLLILTWDEDGGSQGNHIPTIFLGQQVRPGRYRQPVTHYGVLRTIEDAYRLRPDGKAATARPVTAIWRS
ncbi:MAG TPA: alkaline phosphatase family protein [Streptosporangiaceae bacterium]|nr:alkaline phosphatase family protein [Streptosporangiaceae bacterium]